MTEVAIFHSALGVRPGITEAAERLSGAGHQVTVVDQYNGRIFDSYEEAERFVQTLGFPELMQRALEAVEGFSEGFVALGFSNGAGMAEYVASQRPCRGVILISGALPVEMFGANAWPSNAAVQMHYTLNDPFLKREWTDALSKTIRAADVPFDIYVYPGDGHLFTDPSRVGEYQAADSDLVWQRVLAFPPLNGTHSPA